MSELSIAIIAGLGGMLGWGFADFFAKKTIDTIGDIQSLVWAHVCGTGIFIIAVLARFTFFHTSITIPHDITTWLGLAFFGILQAIVYLLAYRGFGKGQVAVLNPIFASFTGIVALISILFLGEVVTGSALFALLIIFIGILLINLDINALKARQFKIATTPGLKEILLATLLAAVWTISWDRFVIGQDAIAYALYMYLLMTVTTIVYAKWHKTNLSFQQKGMWKFLVGIGVCEIVAYAAITVGYSSTSLVSIVALLSGTFSLPTIILARVFLGERPNKLQTYGAFVVILGIAALSLL